MNDKIGLFALVLLLGLSFFVGAFVKTVLDIPAPRPLDVVVPYYHCPDPEHQELRYPGRYMLDGHQGLYCVPKDVPAR
jgi:hypothetical protein